MRVLLAILFCISIAAGQMAGFTEQEKIQGYKSTPDSAYFIFDEQMYDVRPDRVVIEGSFRDWNHDMNDSRWHLKRVSPNGLWLLAVANPEFSIVPAGSVFKYRINACEWLSPPAGPPNQKSGNLVFAHLDSPLRLEAEIAGPEDIRLIVKSGKVDYRYSPGLYELTDYSGREIPVKKVFYVEPGVLRIIPAEKLNIRRLHFLNTPYQKDRLTITYDGWFRQLYSDKELGANYDPDENATWIRLFAPRADLIKCYLYREPFGEADSVIKLIRDENGVWETRLPGNLEGWYYDFTAHGPDEPGNRFYESNPVHFTDPWGRVSVDTFGPARIFPKMTPAPPLKNGIPAMEDVIAYEVHIQDFTRFLPVDEKLKGAFDGFVLPGLRNSKGEKIGFDHIVDLGVNVVHLMPVQEYLHYPDDEWSEAFQNDPYMIEQGISKENYQWGYRTSHAFAIESRYRKKGTDWGAQNEQFRDLVAAFHQKDIAVIVDLVFNHTAEKMDGRQYYFNFSAIDIPYFYRTNEQLDYLGEYGTETKSEERPMMQRWIIEQCTNLINQYGVDGFRIDLAGQTDEQTLKALREAVGDDKIIYGEPWIASADPDYENNPDWDWYKEDSPITFFQDDSRNAFKGAPSNPMDKLRDRGYAGGNGDRENVKKALSAGFPEDKTAVSGINYLDIHDNWALADRFATTDWDGRRGVDENPFKIAATLLFTSTGPIVLHGGTEMMRSKGLAPLEETVKYTRNGPLHFHGKRDTYNLANANAFIWENKGKNMGSEPDIHCNYAEMYEFWKGLIAFRLSEAGKVFRIKEKPEMDYYRWIEPQNSKLLGYFVNNSILVLLNTDTVPGRFSGVIFPEGQWRLIGNNERINHVQGISGKKDSGLKGGRSHDLEMGPESLKIWIRH